LKEEERRGKERREEGKTILILHTSTIGHLHEFE
jgi:hypothetical protein